MSSRPLKCVTSAFSGGVDISEAPGCHLLRQMSSQLGSQKLVQGFELWSYYQKDVKQIILNDTVL